MAITSVAVCGAAGCRRHAVAGIVGWRIPSLQRDHCCVSCCTCLIRILYEVYCDIKVVCTSYIMPCGHFIFWSYKIPRADGTGRTVQKRRRISFFFFQYMHEEMTFRCSASPRKLKSAPTPSSLLPELVGFLFGLEVSSSLFRAHTAPLLRTWREGTVEVDGAPPYLLARPWRQSTLL